MYLARFVLTTADSATSQSEAELLHDALWAHLGHGHDIEHITATAVPGGIDLVLFLSHDIPDLDPVRYGRQVLVEIARRSPLVNRWIAPAFTSDS